MPFAAFRTAVAADWGEIGPDSFAALRDRSEPSEIHEFVEEGQTYSLGLASCEEHLDAASALIQNMYSRRGYEVAAPLGFSRHRITLLAWRCRQIVGTLTIGLDSPDGLCVDDHYKEHADRLRAEGRRICEVTRLAVQNAARSRRLLASLFHLGFIYAYRLRGCTDSLIEINPRHVPFYSHLLGFMVLGKLKTCARVNAPARLMRLELASAHRRIRGMGDQEHRSASGRSFYRHAFSPSEEDGVASRLIAAS